MVKRRVLAASLLLLAGACKPEFDGRASQVTAPRVLAIRSQPAQAAPGEPVVLTALFTGPDPTALSWAICNDRKPLTELGPINPSCLVPASSGLVDVGAGDSVMAEIPKDACRNFGPDTPEAKDGEPPGRPVDPDQTGGYYQPVRIVLPGDEYATGSTRLVCGVAGATSEAIAQLTKRARANTNPLIATLTVDGQDVAGDEVDVRPGAKVALRVGWQTCPDVATCGDGICSPDETDVDCPDDCMTKKGCEGAEVYALFDPTTRTVTTRRESLRVSWFADAGEFDVDRTGRTSDDATPSSDNEWTAPASGDVRVWIVLRDDRGGVGWVVKTAHVR